MIAEIPHQAPSRPAPQPSPESNAFWRAARHHTLVLPRCNQCGEFWFPPALFCPACLSGDMALRKVSGRGRVYTFSVVHRANHPAFAGEVPYVVAVIELDEGPRMLSNVVDIDPDKVRCDMRVAVKFLDLAADISIPVFSPSKEGADRNNRSRA